MPVVDETSPSSRGPQPGATFGSDSATSEPPPSRSRRRAANASDVCPNAVKRYLPLVQQVVASLARRLPANVLRDDLLAAGLIGLVDSLHRNGGTDGETFEWYARIRIRGAIFDELRAQDWLPRRARRSVNEASVLPKVLVSIHEGGGLEEAIQCAAVTANPEGEIETRSELRALFRAIDKLPDRERRIVAMHYFRGVKFKDIGAELGVSEPRVSQLHARALDRLRGFLARAA